jgi:hypothetical protein
LNHGQSVEPCGEFPAVFALEKAEIELFPDVVREIGDFSVTSSHSSHSKTRKYFMFAQGLIYNARRLSRKYRDQELKSDFQRECSRNGCASARSRGISRRRDQIAPNLARKSGA